MIPKIIFNARSTEGFNEVEINQYSFPILIDIVATSSVPFQVVSAKLVRVNHRARIRIAELNRFEGDSVYCELFGREFTLSPKGKSDTQQRWSIALSSQVIKVGNSQLEFKMETELI